MRIEARPDNSHVYAVAYAEMKALAETLTIERQPTIPRTVLAAAMIEVVEELLADGVRLRAREIVAELMARALGKIAAPLSYKQKSELDAAMLEHMGPAR